jgi:hypothetical protein
MVIDWIFRYQYDVVGGYDSPCVVLCAHAQKQRFGVRGQG